MLRLPSNFDPLFYMDGNSDFLDGENSPAHHDS